MKVASNARPIFRRGLSPTLGVLGYMLKVMYLKKSLFYNNPGLQFSLNLRFIFHIFDYIIVRAHVSVFVIS